MKNFLYSIVAALLSLIFAILGVSGASELDDPISSAFRYVAFAAGVLYAMAVVASFFTDRMLVTVMGIALASSVSTFILLEGVARFIGEGMDQGFLIWLTIGVAAAFAIWLPLVGRIRLAGSSSNSRPD